MKVWQAASPKLSSIYAEWLGLNSTGQVLTGYLMRCELCCTNDFLYQLHSIRILGLSEIRIALNY
jgi:hypothetical protein